MGKTHQGIRTCNRLADALLDIMGEKDIEAVRIHDITERAGINRQTFYHHFDDIYDLAEFAYDREAAALFGKRTVEETRDVPQPVLIRTILRALEDPSTHLKALLLFVYARNPHGHFYERVSKSVSLIRPVLANAGFSAARIAVYEELWTAAIASVIVTWAQGNVKLKADQLASLLNRGSDILLAAIVQAPRC